MNPANMRYQYNSGGRAAESTLNLMSTLSSCVADSSSAPPGLREVATTPETGNLVPVSVVRAPKCGVS